MPHRLGAEIGVVGPGKVGEGKDRLTATVGGEGSDGDYRDWETDRKSTRLNSSHSAKSRMPSSA